MYVFDPDNMRDIANAGDDTEAIDRVNEMNANYIPYYQTWVANAVDGSRYISVADSSHFVMFDQPQPVIDGILELVAFVRGN